MVESKIPTSTVGTSLLEFKVMPGGQASAFLDSAGEGQLPHWLSVLP
jgi:hypothetical protein